MDDPAAYWDAVLWEQLEAALGKLGMKHSCNRWLSPMRVALLLGSFHTVVELLQCPRLQCHSLHVNTAAPDVFYGPYQSCVHCSQLWLSSG